METITKSARNFIDGIYHYCDRRCETCAFNERCYAFSIQGKHENEEEMKEDHILSQVIRENMTEAMVWVEKSAAETILSPGKDLDEEKMATIIKINHEQSRDHELSVVAREYWTICKNFLEDLRNMTDDAKRLAREVGTGIKTIQQAGVEMKEITGSLNTVQWYMFFIEAKLQRALYSRAKLNDEAQDDFIDLINCTSDANGSAKIALIAIDKSIECWKLLYKKMSTAEETGLSCLAKLERIKKMTLQEFPDAMEFIRPGFDE